MPQRKKHNPEAATAILAVLFLIAQIGLLFLRAKGFSHLLSPYVDDAPVVFGVFVFRGCALLGALLTFVQMIAASVFLIEGPPSMRHRVIRGLAFAGWAMATALDLTLSALAAAKPEQQWIYVFVALTIAVFDTLGGILVIDSLVVPGAIGLLAALKK